MDQGAIEKLSRLRLKEAEELDRQASYGEVSRSCRDCLKTVFQEEKNTDMNVIKHATQPRIQTIF